MTKTILNPSRRPGDSGWPAVLRTPAVIGLAALLAVQLLLAAVSGAVSGGSSRLAPAATDTPFAAFDAEQIERIEVTTPDSEAPLLLSRTDTSWTIPALGDFPAEATRVDQLLDALAGLHRPLPIATSAEARERFKVADDAFEERIVLSDGQGAVSTLILGDSPGFRRRYLRPAGDDSIYDVRFEVFNLSDRSSDWIAHDRLQLEPNQIQRIATNDWTLTKDGETWRLTGADGELDQAKVDELLSTLANLSYRDVLGTEAPEDFDPAAPLLALDIDLAEGDSRRYLIAEQPSEAEDAGKNFVLKADNQPYYFLLSEFDLQPLVETKATDLIQPPESAGAQAASDPADTENAPVRQGPMPPSP
ncbi:DUF4340 domain-containing protein [Thiorhodovibrio frisius]|uniref:DUF4340 domain-containing protein n=1 Tax=Thiorhodovibrio frisius TaxID=631362 RepID=H8YZ72_9GAMM|nr:DUF4340 domain-containing protein [Thiorhodovibrio frisius]EIC21999.1 hypothetical protein Thi970DRAFT_02240 [Thiorhodovibrio frisius]WPL24290.1 hypothetical protein Thiofri_04507 [Thiorhodovibrio frisius]